MKIGIIILSFLSSIMLTSDSSKRKCDDGKFVYEFHIADNNIKVKLKKGVRFYWYDYNSINSTVYGIKGRVLHGEYLKTVLKSGELIERGSFFNGVKEGEWKEWDEKGKLKKIEFWKYGLKNGVYELYNDESGLKIYGSFKKGYKSGQWIEYNGNRKKINTWSKGIKNGEYLEYLDGELIIKGRYRNGLKDGFWIDIKKDSIKKYKKGKLVDKNVAKFWNRIFEKK